MIPFQTTPRDSEGRHRWLLCIRHSLRPCPHGCTLERPADGPANVRDEPTDREIGGARFTASEVAHLSRVESALHRPWESWEGSRRAQPGYAPSDGPGWR